MCAARRARARDRVIRPSCREQTVFGRHALWNMCARHGDGLVKTLEAHDDNNGTCNDGVVAVSATRQCET